MSKIAVIGAGFAGLSSATYLASMGADVDIFEKNSDPGGRARQFKTPNGFVFDMGPSWYWMPDVFDKYFADFGYRREDFYELELIDPSFEVVFKNQTTCIPSSFPALCSLFESIETGAAKQLQAFMKEAEYKYKTAMGGLIQMPGLSLLEVLNKHIFLGLMRVQIFTSLSKHVRKYFSHPALISIMEFPVLFLGAMPQDTPALYSLMNYAGLKLGTWYPSNGGMGRIVEAMMEVAKHNKVTFHFDCPVQSIDVNATKAAGIVTSNGYFHACDAIVATADYHHVEEQILGAESRNYNNEYWDSRTLAPSCLIFYLGISKKIKRLKHHTLFFEEDLLNHAREIYKDPQWPTKPLFYACCPSVTDNTVAPLGCENLFLLMPIAPGLKDTTETREKYFNKLIARLEVHVGENIRDFVVYKRSYCVDDFITDYNAYKGNAYGLANTLMQTAFLKPKMINKKISNLFYAGQLTVPGPGVPPALISGKIAATQLMKRLKLNANETAF